MTPIVLGQYFRSFLVKLSMIESQLGHLCLGGVYLPMVPGNLVPVRVALLSLLLPSRRPRR